MTQRLLVACLAIACATSVHAQSYGANPPTQTYQPTPAAPTVAPTTPAPLQNALTTSAQVGAANTKTQQGAPMIPPRHARMPIAPASGMAGAATPAVGAGAPATTGVAATQPPPRHINKPSGYVPPPPPQMTVAPGVNATIAIAFGHVNRIVTPFRNPQVKTNSTASITVEGPIVYVATTLDEPIGMFVHDANHGERAISVTLIPEDVPPVSTSITLSGQPDTTSFGLDTPTAFDSGIGGMSEDTGMNGFDPTASDLPYVSDLVTVLKDIAKERVPQGYSLEPVQSYVRMMPACVMPGVRLTPRQALVGHEFVVLVNVATNLTNGSVQIQEDACGSRARAVAAWPHRELDPNQSTELYVIVSRRDDNPDASHVRPSLIGESDQ